METLCDLYFSTIFFFLSIILESSQDRKYLKDELAQCSGFRNRAQKEARIFFKVTQQGSSRAEMEAATSLHC